MTFKNPIGQCSLFASPDSYDEMEDYCMGFAGSERVLALTVMSMTMNMCGKYIDAAVLEQQSDLDEQYEKDAQQYLERLRGEDDDKWMTDGL